MLLTQLSPLHTETDCGLSAALMSDPLLLFLHICLSPSRRAVRAAYVSFLLPRRHLLFTPSSSFPFRRPPLHQHCDQYSWSVLTNEFVGKCCAALRLADNEHITVPALAPSDGEASAGIPQGTEMIQKINIWASKTRSLKMDVASGSRVRRL